MKSGSILLAMLVLAGCGGAPIDPAESPAKAEPSVASAAPPITPASAGPAASAAPKAPATWAYSGDEGPTKWGSLSPDYAKCSAGAEQTPIDLLTAAPKGTTLAPLVLQIKPLPGSFIHNGRTVQVPAKGSGSTLTVGAKKFDLVQVHIHTPAEHTLDKKSFDGELHLVHEGEGGAVAVVGVFLKKGKENKALAPYFDHLPAAPTKEPAKAEGVTIDVSSLVPARAPYFTYPGSLTVPPCTEGVTWFVVAAPIEVSDAQIAKFRAAVPGDTNRPLQAVGARKVERYRP